MALVLLGVPIEELYGFLPWENKQFNFAPLRHTFDLIHDRQCSFARADHQASLIAPPRTQQQHNKSDDDSNDFSHIPV
jgi:hypothetical protein